MPRKVNSPKSGSLTPIVVSRERSGRYAGKNTGISTDDPQYKLFKELATKAGHGNLLQIAGKVQGAERNVVRVALAFANAALIGGCKFRLAEDGSVELVSEKPKAPKAEGKPRGRRPKAEAEPKPEEAQVVAE